VVTFEPPTELARFVEKEALPFPVLSDDSRRAYAAFGLQRGRASQVWSWPTAKAYLKGMLHGRCPKMPQGDLNQLGGDVVLDARGQIVFTHRSQNPADRPRVEAILAAVQHAQGIDYEQP
jgi:peroxiredoxin